MAIDVVPYDPDWVVWFEALRVEFADAMKAAHVKVVAIEHVGSTSVPGMVAKPVIDCDIVVARADVSAASNCLVRLGFVPLGEQGIPDRWAFQAPEWMPRNHTYVVLEGSVALRNHLAVRHVLRTDPELREEYAGLKRRLVMSAADSDEYTVGKSQAVQRMLVAAGISAAERMTIAQSQTVTCSAAPQVD